MINIMFIIIIINIRFVNYERYTYADQIDGDDLKW